MKHATRNTLNALSVLICILIALPAIAYVDNQAVSLDGDGDYVLVPASSSLTFSDGITIEAWVWMSALGKNQVIVHKKNGSYNDIWCGLDSSNRLNWLFRIDGSEQQVKYNYSFTTGTWYHIAYTYDAATGIGRTYVNGEKVGEIWAYGNLTFNNTDGWYLGADTDGSSINDYWNGNLDDVRIWNVARTQAEIKAFKDVPLTGNESGLVAYWKLDEAAGTATAADSTPNGNEGTLQDNADFIASDAPISSTESDPDIRVFPTDLTFCETEIGDFTELPVEISNLGQADLQVTNIASDNALFAPSSTSGTVPSLDSLTVLARFSPTAAGTETGTLTISSDDPDSGSVDVSMSGDGAASINRAATFDKDDDYIQVIKDIPETNLTIEFWFRTTQDNVGLFVVGNDSPGHGSHDREIYIDNGGYLKQRVYSAETITSTNSGFNDDSWHHYAMVIEQGVGQKMYVDGQLEATGSKDHSDFTNQDRFIFGYSRYDGWYEGLIDELRIWNVPHSQSAILAFKDQTLIGNETNLIGYWKLDDCPGSRFAQDSTTYGATGFLFDNTTFLDTSRTENPVPTDADIFVYPTSLDFGDVEVGKYAEKAFDITNRGKTDLAVSDITSSDAQLFVSPEPFPGKLETQAVSLAIPYGAIQRVRVRYKPSSADALNATLTITSNDPDSPTTITATGNGVEYRNNAVSFDGDNDYIEVPYNSAFRPNTWTMEVWVKLNSLEDSRRGIMGSGWSYHDFYIGTNDQKFFAWIYKDRNNYGTIFSTFQPNTDQWYHLAASYDGKTLRFYVDGVLQGSAVNGWSTDDRPFYFGSNVGSEDINGVIDEARFWNIARTEEEIQSTKDLLLPQDATGLVGYWRFDEEPGTTTATDFTGHGHRGTLHDNSAFVESDLPLQQAPDSPGIVVAPSSFDFGTVVIGRSAGQTLIVFNKGQQTLQVTDINSTNTAFDAVSASFPLAWGKRREVNVMFTPQSQGAEMGQLTVSSNDPGGVRHAALLGIGRSYVNRTVQLDGNGDMVTVSHDASLNMNNTTVEMWVKPTSDLTEKDVSFIWKERYNDTPFILEQLYDQENSETEELFMWVNDGNSWKKNNVSAYNTFAFAPNEWYHLCGTYDGSLIKLYVNGRLLATRRYTEGSDPRSTPLYIGSSGSDRWFDGLIDDVRIFDYARSQAEIIATMNLTITGDEPGLVGYWPFDDQPGSSQAADDSGNGLIGTLSGNAHFVASDAPTTLPSDDQDIAVFPSTVEFGSVMENDTVQSDLIIINRGLATLQVSNIQSSDAQVTPRMTAFPLLPGEKMEVPLLFTPTATGDFSADLTITSDDPDSGSVVVGMLATVTDTAPASNQSLQLDGDDDYVALDANQDDIGGTSSDGITVEAWIKLGPGASSQEDIIASVDRSEYWRFSSDHASVEWDTTSSGDTTNDMEGNTTLHEGIWYHVAAVYESSTGEKRIYVNGELDGSESAYSAGTTLGTGTTRYGFIGVGSEAESVDGEKTESWFNGGIDEVRIWNNVRTENEIRDNMFTALTGSEAGLVGYWQFSGNADDSSPEGNNGTLMDDATTVESGPPLPPEKGDVNRNGLITSADVILILQASLGFIDLPAIQFYAADVTNNWVVSAYDASLVMQYIAGVIPGFPAPSLDQLAVSPEVSASMADMNFLQSDLIQIPIAISELTDVLSAELTLTYDDSRLKPVRVLKTDLTSQYQLAYKAQDSELRISLANSETASGAGNLVVVEFRALQVPLRNRHDSVQLVKVMLNEGRKVTLRNVAPIPEATKLLANYPNPFNPETWIPYLLAQDANVTIRIYNMNGQLIRHLDLGQQRAGSYITQDKAVRWDGKNEFGESVASGIYFYALQAGDFTATRRMMILK